MQHNEVTGEQTHELRALGREGMAGGLLEGTEGSEWGGEMAAGLRRAQQRTGGSVETGMRGWL